jgi:hypothetical protein
MSVLNFKQFLFESQHLDSINEKDEARFNQDEMKTFWWYRGNPGLQMPINDVLIALRDHFKMSKRDFPAERPEFYSYASAKSKRGQVMLPNGCTLVWYKSSPPNVLLQIEGKDASVLMEMKGLLDKIAGGVKQAVSPQIQAAWNKIPEDVKEIFNTAFQPALSANNLQAILDNNKMKIDFGGSIIEVKDLPRGYKYMPDPQTTNFSINTGKRTVTFEIHKYNTWTIVTW